MHTTVTVCLGAGPMISGSAVPTTAAAIEFGNVRDGHHPGCVPPNLAACSSSGGATGHRWEWVEHRHSRGPQVLGERLRCSLAMRSSGARPGRCGLVDRSIDRHAGRAQAVLHHSMHACPDAVACVLAALVPRAVGLAVRWVLACACTSSSDPNRGSRCLIPARRSVPAATANELLPSRLVLGRHRRRAGASASARTNFAAASERRPKPRRRLSSRESSRRPRTGTRQALVKAEVSASARAAFAGS